MTELELITAVGAHDATLDDLDKRIAAAKARVPDGQAGVAEAERRLAEAEAALKASKDAEKALLREVRNNGNRKSSATRALESGIGDPDAAERQLAQLAELLDELETQQLEQMETSESAVEGVEAAKVALAEAEAVLAAARVEAPPIVQTLGSQRAGEQLVRDGVWEQMPREVQNRYAMIRKKRRTAVSLLEDGYCKPCRRKVPLQEGSDVRTKGLVRTCVNCGRYLVLTLTVDG